MTPEKQQEIAQALQAKVALGDCPACRHWNRAVRAGYLGLPFSETGVFPAPGTSMVCAIVECQNCGFIAPHNLAALGIRVE